MKESRIVPVVSVAKHLAQPLVDMSAALQGSQTTILLNASILTNAEKNDAINGLLNCKVQLALGKQRITQGNITGKNLPPEFNLLEKGGIDLSCSLFELRRFGIVVERASEDRFPRKNARQLVPMVRVARVCEIQCASGRRFVMFVWFNPAVIDGKLFKVREDAERKFG
jgi:hypothetical protein